MPQSVVKALFVAVALASSLATPAVSAQPRDLMLVLDNSGSMRKNDPDFLTGVAVKAFIRNLRGDVLLGIIIFDEEVDLAVPLSPLTVDTRSRYLDSLERVDYRGQWTDSSAALERAVYELRTQGRAPAQKSIVVMTDGIVDTGNEARDVERTRWMQEELSAQASDAGVSIFGIAFTDNADFQLIQSLAHRTGGEYYRAYAATDIERVFLDINDNLDAALAPLPEPVPEPVATLPPMPTPAPEISVPSVLPTLPPEPPPMPPADTAAGDGDLASLPVPAPAPAADGTGLPSLPPPEPAPAAVTADEASSSARTEPPAATTTAAPAAGARPEGEPPVAGSGADTPGPAGDPPPPSSTVPWLLVGGGALAVVVGGGVFLWLRRRGPRSADPGVPKASLNDLSGATDKSSHQLGAIPTVIGRMPTGEGEAANCIVIEESTIGRRHAVIEYAEHAYWVSDQNSLNGTFLNNDRIHERTRLKHGDRIRFHRREFEFVLWEMFDSDRTEMSQTRFTQKLEEIEAEEDEDATLVRGRSGGGSSAAGA